MDPSSITHFKEGRRLMNEKEQKGRDREKKKWEKNGGKKRKRLMEIVATTSLPAVNRPNAGTPHARANYQIHFARE